MMNKIFLILLFLTVLGSAVLLWLLKTLPEVPSSSHIPKTEVTLTPEGPKVIDQNLGQPAADTPAAEIEQKLNDQVSALESAKAKTRAPRLNITSTPVPAIVFVDGELKGQTPVSVELTEKVQIVKLEAAGFESIVKESPTQKEISNLENLNWRVALKKADQVESSKRQDMMESQPVTPMSSAPIKAISPQKTTSGSSVQASTPMSDDLFLKGRAGPVWIQLRALQKVGNGAAQISELKNLVDQFKSHTEFELLACEVSLKQKGLWYRLLVGPFDNKGEAQSYLPQVKEKIEANAFVTGVQECR